MMCAKNFENGEGKGASIRSKILTYMGATWKCATISKKLAQNVKSGKEMMYAINENREGATHGVEILIYMGATRPKPTD
jgi:hypothetical protein